MEGQTRQPQRTPLVSTPPRACREKKRGGQCRARGPCSGAWIPSRLGSARREPKSKKRPVGRRRRRLRAKDRIPSSDEGGQEKAETAGPAAPEIGRGKVSAPIR